MRFRAFVYIYSVRALPLSRSILRATLLTVQDESKRCVKQIISSLEEVFVVMLLTIE